VIAIRPERPDDHPFVREVNERAFGGPAEARLVDMLRAAGKAVVSLVAVDAGGRVVGHVMFSRVTVDGAPAGLRAVGLAPMSVLPEVQNRGIGSRLVREGLAACKREGCDVVVVLGHAAYYPRFGFVRAKDHGLHDEYGAVEAFMAMELTQGVLGRVRGLVKYASELREAGC
jgi:putative acetyltransferase